MRRRGVFTEARIAIADAALYGDPDGAGIHFSSDSVRYLWLDRARQLRV